jgi:predicted membrane protein
MSVIIEANAATLDITIPDNAEAQVDVTTNIGTLNIDNRFIKEGNYYKTKNYNEASDHIELEIRSNVSTVTIN